jgi:hypothetical protein
MVETKTVNGAIERGNAKQRHFARAIDRDTGAVVVVSHSSGTVAIGVPPEEMGTVLDLAAEWGGEPSFDLHALPHKAWQYDDGDVALEVTF